MVICSTWTQHLEVSSSGQDIEGVESSLKILPLQDDVFGQDMVLDAIQLFTQTIQLLLN